VSTKAGAGAGLAADLDGAAELLDGVAYDVEADAAAGGLGDGAGGGERGGEQQLEQRRAGQGGVGSEQAELDRLGAHAVLVDADAVVADLEHDGAGDAAGADAHHGLGRLAGGDAGGGVLAAVVDGVDDQVLERVGDAVQDLLVDLDVLAGGLQPDGLAGGLRDVAHDPRQRREGTPHRHHRQAHRPVPHQGHAAAVPLDELAQAAHGPADLVAGADQAVQRRATSGGSVEACRSVACRSVAAQRACSAASDSSPVVVCSMRRAPRSASPTTSSRSYTLLAATRTESLPVRTIASGGAGEVGATGSRGAARRSTPRADLPGRRAAAAPVTVAAVTLGASTGTVAGSAPSTAAARAATTGSRSSSDSSPPGRRGRSRRRRRAAGRRGPCVRRSGRRAGRRAGPPSSGRRAGRRSGQHPASP
jgi:hypothetical protein